MKPIQNKKPTHTCVDCVFYKRIDNEKGKCHFDIAEKIVARDARLCKSFMLDELPY